jgi:hypothetical protein
MSPQHYREMARECLQEAADTEDEARKKTLLEIAKLYSETALAMEVAQAAPSVPPVSHAPES